MKLCWLGCGILAALLALSLLCGMLTQRSTRDAAAALEQALEALDRDETAQALRALGFTVTDSKTNFLFAGAHPAVSGGEYYAALRQSSILVRHFTLPRIENWVRITVGTAAQMQRLVDVTKQILDARHSAAR